MGIDSDLSALLPDPPPPRPARREAAIAEAVRRFDAPAGETPPPRVHAKPVSARPFWARPQVAAFASVALVVMVSVPIWWSQRDRIVSNVPVNPAPAVVQGSPVPARALAPQAPAQSEAADAKPGESVEAALPEVSAAAPGIAPAEVVTFTVPPPAQVQGLPQLPARAPAPAAALSNRTFGATASAAREATTEAESDNMAIVVTGSRVEGDFSARAPIPPVPDAASLDGEWNACTLRDPRRNPTRCREGGRASDQLDNGLALAWQGDLDRAIAEFDRAISASPDLALAYLNRGLAYQQKGDLGRALADLNRAVARDRTNAQGYYHRSQLYRARGDTERADADAKRAKELDPAYEAALP